MAKAKNPRAPKVAPTPEEVIFSENPVEQLEVPELDATSSEGSNEPDTVEEVEQPKTESPASENPEDTGAESPGNSLTESPGNSGNSLTESPGNSLTESPGNSESSLTESPGDSAADTPSAHLYKLRPDVADDKSKWAVQIKTGNNQFHRIFVGSLIRARIRAFTYNVKHNLAKAEIKLISK